MVKWSFRELNVVNKEDRKGKGSVGSGKGTFIAHSTSGNIDVIFKLILPLPFHFGRCLLIVIFCCSYAEIFVRCAKTVKVRLNKTAANITEIVQ